MRIIFAGDIVGNVAAQAVANWIEILKEENHADFFIVNGENAADGNGITISQVKLLLNSGVDCITLGNHSWGHWGISKYIDKEPRLLRPGNVPESWPGRSSVLLENNTFKLRVINVLGKVYMTSHVCPFAFIEQDIATQDASIPTLVDFHAEASAEKEAMGRFLAGKVSAVLGTHTHVQTADEKILDGYTGFITDVGMCGPTGGVIGMDQDQSLRRFVEQLPSSYKIAQGPIEIRAVYLELGEEGQCETIKRIKLTELYPNEWQGLPPALISIDR